jgi:hypothetical protein
MPLVDPAECEVAQFEQHNWLIEKKIAQLRSALVFLAR